MASIADDREESILEGQQKSLLDFIEERNRTLNKKNLLHRMVYISKMYHQNFQEIGQYYEKFFRDTQNQYQCEGVTGLLLLYPKHCVHVVETSVEILYELVKDLRKQAQAGEGHMEKAKVLSISHNIPHRLYQHWSHRVLDIEAPLSDDYDSTDDAEGVVVDILTNLLKLGTHLSRQPKVSLKSTMDSLYEKYPDLLPQQGSIGFLLESDMVQCILTPDEYLDMYEKPQDVLLEADLIWPMPVKLFPYN